MIFPQSAGRWSLGSGYPDSQRVRSVHLNGVRDPHSPPAHHLLKQELQVPQHGTPQGPRSGPGHHGKSLRLLELNPLISLLSLPTRVPISANNNIHINGFLDHSHQNTRDSWQGGLPLCHHVAYLLGTWWEILAIPSLTSALRALESSCDFKLSFSGVDWWKWSCHPWICFQMRSWLSSGLVFENQPSWVLYSSRVITVPPLL